MHTMAAMPILHATIILVVAYGVYFLATRSEGLASFLGKLLAVWLLILAVLAGVMGVVRMGHHEPGWNPMMDGNGPPWMRREKPETPLPAPPPDAPPAPPTTVPTPPAPPSPPATPTQP